MPQLTKESIKFLQDLNKNNNKEWFDAERTRYEQHVKKPFAELVTKLCNAIRDIDPYMDTTAKDAIFRINRDTRFSNNKEPYKTNIGAAIGPGGRKGTPTFYIHVEPKMCMIAGGAYMVDKDQLLAIRTHMAHNQEEWETAISSKIFSTVYGSMQGEKNKIVPPAFKEAATHFPLIANKQFYFSRQVDTSIFLSDSAIDTILQHYIAARPVNALLRAALQ